MIYFKGPKAPDFHFEKIPAIPQKDCQSGVPQKKAARPIVYSFRSESSGFPSGNPASRSPLSAGRGFVLLSFPLPVKDSSAPPHSRREGRGGLLPYHIPGCPVNTQTPSPADFFSFFFRRLRPARPPGPFSAPGYGASVSAFIPHIPSPCQHFFSVFPLFFFHPPPSRRRFHRPGPGEGCPAEHCHAGGLLCYNPRNQSTF